MGCLTTVKCPDTCYRFLPVKGLLHQPSVHDNKHAIQLLPQIYFPVNPKLFATIIRNVFSVVVPKLVKRDE